MEIYTSEEKDATLKEIVLEDYISIYIPREMAIVDEYLYPDGYVEKPIRLSPPEHYICVATRKGKDFIEAGGYQAIEKEQNEIRDRKIEIERLTADNLKLQNDELEYKQKIRRQESVIRMHQCIEALLFLAGLIYFLLKD